MVGLHRKRLSRKEMRRRSGRICSTDSPRTPILARRKMGEKRCKTVSNHCHRLPKPANDCHTTRVVGDPAEQGSDGPIHPPRSRSVGRAVRFEVGAIDAHPELGGVIPLQGRWKKRTRDSRRSASSPSCSFRCNFGPAEPRRQCRIPIGLSQVNRLFQFEDWVARCWRPRHGRVFGQFARPSRSR